MADAFFSTERLPVVEPFRQARAGAAGAVAS
jgi:hypothetical protein